MAVAVALAARSGKEARRRGDWHFVNASLRLSCRAAFLARVDGLMRIGSIVGVVALCAALAAFANPSAIA